MPARNAAKTIGTAMVSVLRGLPDDADLLVLDDASEDGTRDIIVGLARRDRRVHLITSDSASGVAGACNLLIEACDSPLVARMDADDIALPWRFASQLRALKRRSLDAVFTPAVMFGPSRTAFRPQPPVEAGPSATPLELLLTCTLMHPSLLGRRAAVIRAGGYRLVAAEDWDLFMRMALNGDRMARIALPGILYRRHATQVTATGSWYRALTNDAITAGVHEELSMRMLGLGPGAYAALVGPYANQCGVNAALQLIDEVWKAAGSFALADLIGVRTNALGVKRQIKQRYPQSVSSRSLRHR
jgi:glycosyltransferase involved in cell wall biosynthesis